MKEQIKKLYKELRRLSERLEKVECAINALQNVCEHKLDDGECAFVKTGRDSHKTYYECSVCLVEYSE